MSKKIFIILGIVVLALLGYGVFKQKVGNVNLPSTADTTTEDTANDSEGSVALKGFTLPDGFAMSIYAKDVPGARVMETDPMGRLLVSETSEGKIVALEDTNNNGVADKNTVIIKDLKQPSGMAMKCGGTCNLYVAENNQLSRFNYDPATMKIGTQEILMPIDHSATDNHFSRSLLFLPSPNDTTLLISVGSTCNVCNEKSTDHAAVLYYDLVTKQHGVYARGLRNSPFLTLNLVTGKVFGTEMGRDGLGDNIPPDEINIIEKGKNYGWPVCYGKNIHDTNFDKNTYIRNPCMEPLETQSFVDLQAHSAPLGLGFVPEEGWPEQYWNNILVAFHGSWNRSELTGYKIARVVLDSKGNYVKTEDFITGWLDAEGKKTGRPVDIKIFPGGKMYITDDSSGVVYQVSRIK